MALWCVGGGSDEQFLELSEGAGVQGLGAVANQYERARDGSLISVSRRVCA